MKNTNVFIGVGGAAIAWPLRGTGSAAASGHHAAAHAAGVAAAVTPQRKRHTATAIVASVNRGTAR
jgi:hypothetical protein